MGAAGSSPLDGRLTKAETERVIRRFERQTGRAGRMSIADFENIPEFSGKPYIGCIFQFADTDNDGYITVNDFVAAMEGLGRIYSEDEKLHFAFGMYDLDKDGFISLDDLTEILQHTTKGHSDPLRVKMIAASLLQEYDMDHDGRLSYPEFKQLAAAGGEEARPFLG